MLYIFFLIILGLLIYSIFIETNRFKIKKIPLYLKNLPLSFKGDTILQISDTHIKRLNKHKIRVLKKIKKINPNYIVVTGDILDSSSKSIQPCKDFFKKMLEFFQADHIFVVLGNHAHLNKFINNVELIQSLKSLGIHVLINESTKIEKNGEYVNIIGVDDPTTGHDNIKKALNGIKTDQVNILLSHCLEIAEKVKPNKVDVVLTGHTHGGQVKIPGIRPFWIPNKYKGKYVSGMYKINSLPVYVNIGIATSTFPIRFNAVPEITLFTLYKK